MFRIGRHFCCGVGFGLRHRCRLGDASYHRSVSRTRRAPSQSLLIRRDKAGAAVIRAWRDMTDSGAAGRTLIACSGGADSSALVLCLCAAGASNCGVAHVVHDMRPRPSALADRDAARSLAERCRVPFYEAEVSVRAKGLNMEARARRARYEALRRIAEDQKYAFIATAHHADDQAETVLMRLVRGAGPRGLGAMGAGRPIGAAVLVRPMLDVTHQDALRICRLAGWNWREDITNTDLTRLRSAIRHRVMPILRELTPDASKRMSRAAQLCRGAAKIVERLARQQLNQAECSGGVLFWPRSFLRRSSATIAGEVLRLAAAEVMQGRGLDRITYRALSPVIRACRDRKEHRREFTISGVTFGVDANRVWVAPRGQSARKNPLLKRESASVRETGQHKGKKE